MLIPYASCWIFCHLLFRHCRFSPIFSHVAFRIIFAYFHTLSPRRSMPLPPLLLTLFAIFRAPLLPAAAFHYFHAFIAISLIRHDFLRRRCFSRLSFHYAAISLFIAAIFFRRRFLRHYFAIHFSLATPPLMPPILFLFSAAADFAADYAADTPFHFREAIAAAAAMPRFLLLLFAIISPMIADCRHCFFHA